MSPQLHAEIAFAREREIAARTNHAHHVIDLPARVRRSRPLKSRVNQSVAALGACVAITAGIAVNGAFANQTHPASTRASAQQLQREIAHLKSQGYFPISCTLDGTLLRNPRTGQVRTIKW
jgi:hypothetical protein